jgi:hypothetical protein
MGIKSLLGDVFVRAESWRAEGIRIAKAPTFLVIMESRIEAAERTGT